MGWREDVKFGIARISRLFLGANEGDLGIEVDTDKIIDIANNQVATAAEVDAAVSGGGFAGYFLKDALPGSENGLAIACFNGLAISGAISATPIAPNCNWIARLTAADVLRAVWCDPARQADLEYFIGPLGVGFPGPPGSPGWEADPEASFVEYTDIFLDTQQFELWCNDGIFMTFCTSYVLVFTDGLSGGELGVDSSGCGGPS